MGGIKLSNWGCFLLACLFWGDSDDGQIMRPAGYALRLHRDVLNGNHLPGCTWVFNSREVSGLEPSSWVDETQLSRYARYN